MGWVVLSVIAKVGGLGEVGRLRRSSDLDSGDWWS